VLQLGQREWWLAYSAALRILRVPDQAEDVAQEALLRAFRARDSYDGRAAPESWLWRIAHNAAISHARAASRFAAVADSQRILDRTASVAQLGPESAAANRESVQALEECLRAMNEPNRNAYILHLLGATMEELGAALGISPNAAKQRVFRARRRVRHRMAELASFAV